MSLRYRAVKKITRQVKARILSELENLLRENKFFIVADLVKIGSSELQAMRRMLRGIAVLKVARNRLVEKAIERVHNTKIEFTGQNIFIFTNKNPYELYLFLQKNKILTEAQPGMIAPKDIIVNEGNTGLTPGPVLSKFSKLKVPTKIVEGSVWIAKDTVVAKKGEVISKDVVELLNLLGIKPIETTLNLKFAFDGKSLLKEITIDLDKIREDIKKAHQDSLNLAIQVSLPIREVMPILISKAYLDYLKVAESLVLPEKEILERNLVKAESLAKVLYEKIKDKV
jgi:large subunit ribosomal protein L10